SEASLVKELERLGIGRPSTYATIISTLKTRWYATAKDRRFAPTPLGETVWQVMKRSFPAVFDVGFTAQMEDELDKVEEGDLAWPRYPAECRYTRPLRRDKVPDKPTDEICQECGAPMVIKTGR